jgi:competence transcription factor ComK
VTGVQTCALPISFTIPYTPNGTSVTTVVPGMQKEDAEIVLETIDQLKKIADSSKTHSNVKFKNGSSMKVDHYTASAIHQVHNALNDQNKAKVARMVAHSPEQFKKVADFALSKTTFKINDK